MNKNFIYIILAMKGMLVVWGVLGFVEYFVPTAAFGLQDSNFPAGVQFLHWLLISLTGITFILGFLKRWRYTPFVTIIMYATLATLCFVETVDFNAFGGGERRFFIMSVEYFLYIILSTYLLRSTQVRLRFQSHEQLHNKQLNPTVQIVPLFAKSRKKRANSHGGLAQRQITR